MANTIHPGAPHHLPPFITAPGETDYFYNGSAIFLVLMILIAGSLYFRLHALPERLAHKHPNKVQFQIVAVLTLLALFTHNTLYWVAALLLAFVRFPDLSTPLAAIADAVTRLANRRRTFIQERVIDDGNLAPLAADVGEHSQTDVPPVPQFGPPVEQPLAQDAHEVEQTGRAKPQIRERA